MVLLAFDRTRVDSLRMALGTALDELCGIRSSEPEAADTLRVLAGACRTLGEIWLPRVHDVLASTAMTRCTRSAAGVVDIAQASIAATALHPGWETATDSTPVYGPPAPHTKSFDEVLADIRSGSLRPMAAPLDANGRAGARYTSLAFAPGTQREIGQVDLTSDAAKFIDFLSDGLPVGWRENDRLTLYYLTDVRVMQIVRVLNAYPREQGPDTLPELTTEAVTSGYMLVNSRSTTGEVTVGIGPGEQDPTASVALASESTDSYSGAFYPDTPPDFQPITDEPRFVNQTEWTFSKAPATPVDGEGTWDP
ncbi:MAG: hypothetical protein ABI706_15575 [Ilumatobacteraceae bacterium]